MPEQPDHKRRLLGNIGKHGNKPANSKPEDAAQPAQPIGGTPGAIPTGPTGSAQLAAPAEESTNSAQPAAAPPAPSQQVQVPSRPAAITVPPANPAPAAATIPGASAAPTAAPAPAASSAPTTPAAAPAKPATPTARPAAAQEKKAKPEKPKNKKPLPKVKIKPPPPPAKPKPERPRLQTGKYISLIKGLGQLSHVQCPYCHAANLASGDVWICHKCELALHSGTAMPKNNDIEFSSAINSINENAAAGEYDKADTDYDALVKKYNEPAVLYSYALFSIERSNYEVSQIRYDLPRGFMEPNAEHRKKASVIHSKALMLLNKASLMCQREFAGGAGDAYLAHTYFIINIKLSHMKEARTALEMIAKYGNAPITAYDSMIFDINTGRFTDAAKHAESLAGRPNLMPGAFYYLAWLLFKVGNYSGSRRVLEGLGKLIQNSSIDDLLSDIRKATTL